MYGGDYMQEISMKPTARIYDFSELQKKKRQRELREKRPFFITGVVLIISLLCISFFFSCMSLHPPEVFSLSLPRHTHRKASGYRLPVCASRQAGASRRFLKIQKPHTKTKPEARSTGILPAANATGCR